jgi:hypothetical protein
MSDNLVYLCSNFRPEVDPRSMAFANVAEKRTDQSYLASTTFEEDSLMDFNTIQEIVTALGRQSFLSDLDTRSDAFVQFLRSFNAAISSTLPLNYVSCSIDTRSPEESVRFHMYCLLACNLFYSPSITTFHKLGPFVANVATRIYRLPKSAGIMRAIINTNRFRQFSVNVQGESKEYALLLSCFDRALNGQNHD